MSNTSPFAALATAETALVAQVLATAETALVAQVHAAARAVAAVGSSLPEALAELKREANLAKERLAAARAERARMSHTATRGHQTTSAHPPWLHEAAPSPFLKSRNGGGEAPGQSALVLTRRRLPDRITAAPG
jgi:hypothetical protein